MKSSNIKSSQAKRSSHRLSRREMLWQSGGVMGLLLKGLATGLPPTWLSLSGIAHAQANQALLPQTLILSTSSQGDPINANCPGAYFEGADNNPAFTPTPCQFGTQTVTAANVWGVLPADLRARLAFFHYSSRTAAHPEYTKAMALHGAVKNQQGNGSDMLCSALASMSQEALTTLQVEPIPLCNELLTFDSQSIQNIRPSELKALFEPQGDNLANLRTIRDQALNELYATLQTDGTRAQKKFIDRYILSRDQARELGEDLGALLDRLPVNADEIDGPADQMIAAVALARLRIAPVITIKIPFGGDNHQDADLSIEAAETTAGVQHIATLWQELNTQQLQDQVTFALLNVFGRQFTRNSVGGRDHNRFHGVMVAFGAGIQGGMYGGVNTNGQAMNIDTQTGSAVESGGISADIALESAGATLARAIGYSEEAVSYRIQGQVVNAMLRG
jgi:hypothetical protein